MIDLRISYYLFGIILFFIPKVISSFNFWGLKSDEKPKLSWGSLFYFLAGEMFLFFTILDIISTISLGVPLIFAQYYEFIPYILLILICIVFMVQPIIQLSKNSIIAVIISGVCTLIIMLVLFDLIVNYRFLVGIFDYSEDALFAIISIFSGLFVGMGLYKILNTKNPENSEIIYTNDRIWRIFNNYIFLLIILIISIIEVYLQFNGYSIISFINTFF